jgi:alkanesulfonate monooxygenase
VSSFLLRGFDPMADTTEFGRELIPRIKAGAVAIDAQIPSAEEA